jgi:hypothetical protein
LARTSSIARLVASVSPFRRPRLRLLLFVAVFSLLAACAPSTAGPAAGDKVPHLDDLIGAVGSGSPDDLLPLVAFSSLPCTTAEGMGGPPKCLPGEAEGTLVEVLPVLGPEGHHMRRAAFDNWPGLGSAQFYAAFRNAPDTYSDEFFPAGDYGVAFDQGKQGYVVFRLTGDGIVRLDYLVGQSIDDLLEESEIIVGPTPPAG